MKRDLDTSSGTPTGSSTPSPTALSATGPRAPLTTPFTYQSGCAELWDLTSAPTTDYPEYGLSTVIDIALSDRADPRFQSCQPSGWENAPSASRFSLSPAVCPSGWTAYALATQPLFESNQFLGTGSTAYCCASGFNLHSASTAFLLSSLTRPCTRTVGDGRAADQLTLTLAAADGSGATAVMTKGLQVHEAWHITWQQTDLATLSPVPPDLANYTLIPTWVPGSPVVAAVSSSESPAPSATAPSPAAPSSRGGGLGFSIIWIVIIAVVVGVGLAVIVGVCWRRAIKRRRNAASAPEQTELQNQTPKQERIRYA